MPTLTFTEGADSYTVTGTDSYTLNFLGGADTLDVSGGTFTTASMGAGNDRVYLRNGDALVNGDVGADRFDIYGGGFEARGGDDGDLFMVHGGANLTLSGESGSDRFTFTAAVTSLLARGGLGNDVFDGNGYAIAGTLYGHDGNDSFFDFSNASGGAQLRGGLGNDTYRYTAGTSARFIELAGEGTDVVQVARGVSYTLPANIENISVGTYTGGTMGAASLTGNALANVITGHANAESMFGGRGNDRLIGNLGDDTLSGGYGNDFLDGGDGNDTINGGEGHDTLQGRAGIDSMTGGTGDDTYYVDSYSDAVTELPAEGNDIIRSSATVYLLPDNVETGIAVGLADVSLLGNTLNNLLIGNSGRNNLSGGIGNDTLRGGAGEDDLAGGDGDDVLDGGGGIDSMVGGYGNDIYHVDNEFDWIDEFPGDGTDTAYVDVPANMYGPVWYSLPPELENAILVSPNSGVRGNANNNVLTGSAGADVLFGDDGSDTLNGGKGDDNLWGENGADTINGGAGNDTIFGGANGDLITGGLGADTFYYTAVSDSVFGAFDYIFDVDAPNDVFDLSAIDADTTTPLDQAFTLKSSYTFTPGDLWIHDYGNGQYALMGDTNGDGIADLRILFEYAVRGELNLIL